MDMDRFKFRVAIKQQDGTYKLYRVDQVNYYLHGPEVTYVVPVPEGSSDRYIKVPITGDSAILMQCTGRKDVNDRLIHEADTVLCKTRRIWIDLDPRAPFIGEIRFLRGSYFVINRETQAIERPINNCLDNNTVPRLDLEIIGNIYEEVPHAES